MNKQEDHSTGILIYKAIRFYKMKVFLFFMFFSSIALAGIKESAVKRGQQLVAIDRIYIDEPENEIRITVLFSDKIWTQKLQNKETNLSLTFKTKDTTYVDVPIKRTFQLSETSYLLSFQPPLEAALFKTEKYELVLQIEAFSSVYESRKAAILGSIPETFDLRPYTHTNTVHFFMSSFLLVFLLTLLLMGATPIYQKYLFKKNHIKKYATVKEEDTQVQDPFTFVPFQDSDKVVVVQKKIMLLTSWKTLEKLPESKPAQDHEEFFAEKREGTFFNPKTKSFKKINKAWYGLFGIFLGWVCYVFLADSLLLSFIKVFALLFDSNSLQVSEVLGRNTMLGASICLFYSLSIILSGYYNDNPDAPFKKLLKSFLWKFSMIFTAFLVQALLCVFLIRNFYVAAVFSWIILGFGFAISESSSNIKITVKRALLIGSMACCIYVLLTSSAMTTYIGSAIPFFVGILVVHFLEIFTKQLKINRKQRVQQSLSTLNKLSEKIAHTKQKIKRNKKQTAISEKGEVSVDKNTDTKEDSEIWEYAKKE